jgi:hypothetical protein
MASDSETKQSFQGEFAKRPDIIRLADAHIKMEGMFSNNSNIKITECYMNSTEYQKPKNI